MAVNGETVKTMPLACDRCLMSRRRLRCRKSEGPNRWWSSKGMKSMNGAAAAVVVGQVRESVSNGS